MTAIALGEPDQVAALLPDRVSEAVERVAARFVRTWGFTTVSMVASRFHLWTRTSVPRASLTREALGEVPDVAWLDKDREWFSLADRESPMTRAFAKIRAIARTVDSADVALALGKGRSFGNAPAGVVRAFVSGLMTRAARRPTLDPTAAGVTRHERALVEVFREAGGTGEIKSLRELAAERGLTDAVVNRTLASSPLFLRAGHGTYRLIGVALRRTQLISSPRWQAGL